MKLAQAQAAHATALEAVDTAKQTYFISETDEHRAAVRDAEAHLADVSLVLERAQHLERVARESKAAAERQRLEHEFDALQRTDAQRIAAITAAATELAAVEQQAYALVVKLEQLCQEREADFQPRKRLSLALDREKPVERPADVAFVREFVRRAIRRTHEDKGLLGSNTDITVWLRLAERVLHFGPAPKHTGQPTVY